MREEIGDNSMGEMRPWKDEIITNCRLWVESLEDDQAFPEPVEEPDLYSFYEQLCVLKSEFRKNSRRTHETFSQFGEHLEEFQGVLDFLRQRFDMFSAERSNREALDRQRLLLQTAEIYERLRRVGEKLKERENPPRGQAEAPHAGLRERIRRRFAHTHEAEPDRNAVSEGFSLALSHFEEFLAGEGVCRIDVEGEPFDPSFMVAVGTVPTDADGPDRVSEEIDGGYLYGEHVLKLAKVTVTKRKEL